MQWPRPIAQMPKLVAIRYIICNSILNQGDLIVLQDPMTHFMLSSLKDVKSVLSIKENMTNDNEDATDVDPGNTAAALANAATICNEVIVATGTSNEDFVTAKVPPTSSVPAESTKESNGNKKQVS